MRRKGGRHMTNNRVKNVDGMVGEGVKFERVRRITGYLTGTTERWNGSKIEELNDRVKHGVTRRKRADRDREER